MMQTPELQAQIAVWRQKALDGTLTVEEMRAALDLMRGGGRAAASTPRTSGAKKAAKSIVSGDNLLNELEGL
jgi:hypothetical protein